MKIDITICVPCFNSQSNIEHTIQNIIKAFSSFSYRYEIVVVDDCSTDQTANIVRQLIGKQGNVEIALLENKKRFGLGYGCLRAAQIGKGRYFKMVHSGNVEPSQELVKYLACIGDAEIVASYIREKRSRFRKQLSKLFTVIMSRLSGYSLRYFQGSAVFLREDVISHKTKNYGNAYLAELLVASLNKGRSILEIEIIPVRSNRESSALSFRNVVSVIYCILFVTSRRLMNVLRVPW